MNSAVCTLFEGDYHCGVGALANSLFAEGFRGTIYAGYRGPLPPWANGSPDSAGCTEFCPEAGLRIRFIPVATAVHLTNYKPDFLLQVLEIHCPDAEALFYFDPDITLCCRWSFFEEWVEAGVALCHNTGSWCPRNHPYRHSWRRFLEREGLRCRNELDEYFNAGFIGLRIRDREFLATWADILERLKVAGHIDVSLLTLGKGANPYNVPDQDALNIAAMVTAVPISSIGEEAMGFVYAGSGGLMVHAVGRPKPWAKCFTIRALSGRAPSWADKDYWKFTKTPIRIYSPGWRILKKVDLVCGRILGHYF